MLIRETSICFLLLASFAAAQSSTQAPVESTEPQSDSPRRAPVALSYANSIIVIPAGSRVPLSLKQAISTKTARSGDPVYAVTTFPFVINDRIVIPPGTYVQGKIERAQRGGHFKGRAELLVHFTSMIYPSGYTVVLGGSVENAPGTERTSMKDSEGTIRQDSDTGRKVKSAAEGAGTGAVIGAITGGGRGAGIGAGIGGLAGLAMGSLSRGADIRLEPGTSIEMEIQREITLDANRISSRHQVLVRNVD
jgi:type IV secretion system protein VirB10